MASSCLAPVSVSGGFLLMRSEISPTRFSSIGRTSRVSVQRKSNQTSTRRNLWVSTEYGYVCIAYLDFSANADVYIFAPHDFLLVRGDSSKSGRVDFVAGFLLRSVVVGTLAYDFAPQDYGDGELCNSSLLFQ